MNPVNHAQMNQFAETFDLQAKSESDQFELYSIYSVLNGGSGENVDPFGAHLKGTEFGLDGLAIIVQGNLVTNIDEAESAIAETKYPQIDFFFFQSKTSTSFDYGDISKFFDSIKDFFNGDLAGESDQIDDLIEAKNFLYNNGVKRSNPGIHCYYITTGNYENQPKIKRLVDNTKDELIETNIFDESRIDINLIGAAALQQNYRSAMTASEVTIEFDRNIVLPKHDSVEEGYIGYIPAAELLKIISIYDDSGNILSINKSVFFDNIRDFNSNSKINLEILSNLQNGEHGNFVYRNNGITVVAKSISRTGNNFVIEDFQIVNGCQTSNIIFQARSVIEGVYIPFRLIGTKDESFIFSIISGTNKQNPVRDEQFWSLLPFMKNLEEVARSGQVLKRIYLERRENQYRSEAIERASIVQMQPFFKAVTATLLGLPHRAARNHKAEIGDHAEEIFSENNDVRPAYAAAFLHYRLEFLWRNQKIEGKNKIFRYYIMDAIAQSILNDRPFLKLNNREKLRFSNELIDLASNEAGICRIVKKVSKIIEEQIDSLGSASPREKIRDLIRTETFFKNARSKYLFKK